MGSQSQVAGWLEEHRGSRCRLHQRFADGGETGYIAAIKREHHLGRIKPAARRPNQIRKQQAHAYLWAATGRTSVLWV